MTTHTCTSACDLHCQTVAERALAAAADTGPLTDRERASLWEIDERSIRDARAITTHGPPDLRSRVLDPGPGRLSLRAAARAARAHAAASTPLPCAPGVLRQGRFQDVLADLADGSVDAIVTDVPWPFRRGQRADVYAETWADLATFSARVLRPGGLLAALVGQAYLPALMSALDATLDWHWLISYIVPNGYGDGGVHSHFYPIVVYANGPATRGLQFKSDVIFESDVIRARVGDHALHPHAKDPDGMAALVERVSIPGELVVDPFAGSNPVGTACERLGRRFLGADIR